VKNKDYWKSGLPYLDEIVFGIVKDEQAMVIQLESGAIDVASPVYEREAARLLKDGKFNVHVNKTGGGVYYIGANVTVPPTDNKKFRQAINYAIDRKRFVDTAMQGLGLAQSLPWPNHSPAYDAAKDGQFAFNLDKAAALVKESGVSNTEVEYIYISSNESMAAMGQILQSDLAKIGVKLSLKGLEPLRWREQSESFKYQLNASSSSAANLDPSSMFSMSRPWSTSANNAGFKSERYTKLANDMATEVDPLKRKQLYSEMNDLILDECFMIPISPQMSGAALSKKVQWKNNRLGGTLLMETAWIS
jgi:peptide/nickel transport system substrate-binding protein